MNSIVFGGMFCLIIMGGGSSCLGHLLLIYYGLICVFVNLEGVYVHICVFLLFFIIMPCLDLFICLLADFQKRKKRHWNWVSGEVRSI